MTRNVSDRGGVGAPPGSAFRDWHESRERRDREVIDSRLDNVRTLTREDIASMNETYGAERVAAAIVAAATTQLQSIKLEVETLSDGERHVHRVGDGLKPEDVDWINHRARVARARQQTHEQLRNEAEVRVIEQVAAMVGEMDLGDYRGSTTDRVVRAMQTTGALENLLRTPKRKREPLLRWYVDRLTRPATKEPDDEEA